MKNLNIPVIKVSELWQVCIVVHDVDKTMKSLWDTFGIGPWEVYIRDPESKNINEVTTHMTYYGKPARFGYVMARTYGTEGIKLELIQPVEGDSIYADFLRDHGEGIQHLGWYVVDTLEAFLQTTRKLETGGFPCIMSGRHPGSAFAYFDTTKVLNTVLEVVWRDPKIKRPPPNRIFPE